MSQDFQKVICPSCKAEISLDEAITHQFEDTIKKQLAAEQQLKQAEFVKREAALAAQEQALANAKQAVATEVAKQAQAAKTDIEKSLRLQIAKEKADEIQSLSLALADKDKNLAAARQAELELRREKTQLEADKQNFALDKQRQLDQEREKIKADALKAYEAERQTKDKDRQQELQLLNTQLTASKQQLDEARAMELNLRKEKIALEDDKRAFEIEKQRQLDAEREYIRLEAQKKAEEEMHLKVAEKDKQLQDAMKANMDLQRKLQQGSQQTQGEVLELELEELLRGWFTRDSIEPVPKGVNGADVIQRVFSNAGQECGLVAWELKHTKAWSEQWVAKLKEDQRKVNADVAVLVTEVLPKDVKSFAYRDGVWIASLDAAFGLGTALRMQLMQATASKLANVGKNEKMEILFAYLSGAEFRHKVEAIVEGFSGMKQDLDKERRAMAKIWAKREKQIEQVVLNTSGMYGDVQGLIGAAVQPIAALELGDGLEDDDEDEEVPVVLEEPQIAVQAAVKMASDKQEYKPEALPF